MTTESNPHKSGADTPHMSDNNGSPDPIVKQNMTFSNKHHKRAYTFDVFENYVEFTPPERKQKQKDRRESPRGKIKAFSPRSRFRLFALLAKVKDINDRPVIFTSLTYHLNYTSDSSKSQSDLHDFLSRLRKIDPGVSYIWRMELQKRGAPHFHLIIFPSTDHEYIGFDLYTARLSLIWHQIADPNSHAHEVYGCKSEPITDYRKACAYLSKYLAKTDQKASGEINGRHWASSNNLPIHMYEYSACNRRQATIILEMLRKWLVSTGKGKYVDSEYWNVDNSQGIFINIETWNRLIRENAGPGVCSMDEWTARDCDEYWQKRFDRENQD